MLCLETHAQNVYHKGGKFQCDPAENSYTMAIAQVQQT